MPSSLFFFFDRSDRFRWGLISLFALLLIAPVSLLSGQGREIELPEITGRGVQPGVRTVFLQSEQEDLQRLVTQVFRTHGAFRLANSAGQADFTFRFTPSGNNQIVLTIESGQPAQTQHRSTVTGRSMRNATLRAADRAVRLTMDMPGYFSGQLSFVRHQGRSREIFISDMGLGESRQLTRDGSDSLSPRWSPDGSRLLYTSYFNTGFPDIFLINLANQSRESLVNLRGTNTGARFSPDGARIAMVLSGGGNGEIFISNERGRNLRRLTQAGSVSSSPTWSPDGRHLVFASDRSGRPQLYFINADGSGMRRIPTNTSGYCAEPDWNWVNPRQIAYTAARSRRFDIVVHDVRSNEHRWITSGPHDSVHPRWLADGRHIIFTARTAQTDVLTIVDTETGKTTPLHPASAGRLSQPDYLSPR